MQSLPPFRPDGKGLVEKSFDLLQQKYKPLLRGHGVIEPDAQERWATDYRDQAVLTLEEFRKILISCILHLKSGRLLSDGKTPAQHWLENNHTLLSADPTEVYHMALPRANLKLTRKGIHFNSIWYAPDPKLSVPIGETYAIAYNPSDISSVYIVTDGEWITCPAMSRNQMSVSVEEANLERQKIRLERKHSEKYELESGIKTISKIQNILRNAEKERGN